MKSRKPIREVLLWVILLGIDAFALWRIDVGFGHGSAFFMDTMPIMLCVGALVPLLVVVFRYLPRRKGIRVVASLVSVVLAIIIGMGALFAFYDHHDILAYYRQMRGKSAWKLVQAAAASDDAALRELYERAMNGELEEGEVAYGDALVFYCLALPDEDGASEGWSSFESAVKYHSFSHVDPDYLAATLDEADTAVFVYPVAEIVGYYNPQGFPAIGTGTPAYAVETMMFAVDLRAGIKSPTVSVDCQEPDEKIMENGRKNANYARYSWSAGVDRVAEEKPEVWRD